MAAHGRGQRHGGRSWSRSPPQVSTGRALGAGVLSLLLPGLGHLSTGRVRRGLRWLGLSLAGGWVLAVLALGVGAPARMLEPRMLLGLLVANAAVGLFRAAAVADAARPLARRGAGLLRRGAAAIALCLLLALALAPHAVAGIYGWHTHRVLTSVFMAAAPAPAPGPSAPPPAPAPGPPATAPGGAGPTPAADGRDLGPGREGAGSGSATPDMRPSQAWGTGGERLTVALLGTDAGPGRRGARTDAILVVSVGLRRGDVAVFSVPRNLTAYPVAGPAGRVRDRYCPTTGGWRQLSALYHCLDRHREATAVEYPYAPDPAARGVADTLGELLGLDVHHYVVADLAGFVRLVDALSGVTVHVARPVRARLSSPEERGAWVEMDIPAGRQVLDGQQALGFARSRTGTDDYDRMRRQRCLVGSLAASAEVGRLLRAFPALAGALVDHVATDIPVDRLADLPRLRALVDLDALVAVGFAPPRFQGPDRRPDVERIRELVRRALDDPASLRREDAGAEGPEAVCR